MRIRTLSFIALLSAALGGVATAQDPLDEMYGRAVHHFFRGDHLTAQEVLNEVIAAGSQDPRVYFFRGLASARNGEIDAAMADFETGAQLEIDGKKVVNVGKSLERIQGCHRLAIEKVRTHARLNSRARVLEMQRSRYDSMQQQGGAVEGGLVVPPKLGGNAPATLAPNDPFNSGMTKGQPKVVEPSADVKPAEVMPEVPVTPTEVDPFGGTTTEPAKPADDPFGT